jgi:hypothetical protein
MGPRAGLSEPVGTDPETVGTGRTGSGSGRFPTGPTFEFEFKINEKISQNSQKYFNVCRI